MKIIQLTRIDPTQTKPNPSKPDTKNANNSTGGYTAASPLYSRHLTFLYDYPPSSTAAHSPPPTTPPSNPNPNSTPPRPVKKQKPHRIESITAAAAVMSVADDNGGIEVAEDNIGGGGGGGRGFNDQYFKTEEEMMKDVEENLNKKSCKETLKSEAGKEIFDPLHRRTAKERAIADKAE